VILPREIQKVQTEYGEIRVKVAWSDREPILPSQHNGVEHNTEQTVNRIITNVQPEYEDCAKIARANNRSWREIHQLAMQTWYRQYG
jgi:hypothetical protein